MRRVALTAPAVFAILLGAAFLCGLAVAHGQGQDPATDQRKHPGVEIFVNNHTFGDKNGCSGALTMKGEIICGHAEHVSKVTWEFLRPAQDGDMYKVRRSYPSDSESPKISTKQVVYTGKPLVIWHDDYQKVILRPAGRTGKGAS